MRQVNVALWMSDELTHAGLASLSNAQQAIALVKKGNGTEVHVMGIGGDHSAEDPAGDLLLAPTRSRPAGENDRGPSSPVSVP